MNHADLITRLEALDGPDRETDALIYIITDTDNRKVVWRDNKLLGVQRNPPHGAYMLGTIAPSKVLRNWTDVSGVTPTPAYTASLDAAIALCEKMLPLVSKSIHVESDNRSNASILCCGVIFRTWHKSPAIALLIAMFKAIDAKE